MVALIEDQMHQHLKNEEEERCRALEKERAGDPKRKDKKVKRRTISKPWSRGTFASLCQDPDLLLMVSEYDYLLEDSDFQAYCAERGVLHVAGTPGTKTWRFFQDPSRSREEYLADPHFRPPDSAIGGHPEQREKYLEVGWEIICIGRAKLQDCWELFQGSRRR